MSHDPADDHRSDAEGTDRNADGAVASADERVRAETAARVADAFSGASGEEAVRQIGLVYGGLIGIALVMVQPLISAPSLDVSATISVVAFSVAIPLLAALLMVNRQETFRGRRTRSVSVRIAHGVAQSAAFVGIVAGFWHIDRIAGVGFLGASIVGLLVHSAGWWRLEKDGASPADGDP
jgi:hypothetical protein